MRAARAWLFSIALLAAAALTGCTPPQRFVPPDDAYTEAARLLQDATARKSALTRLAAEARVEYYGDDGVRKGRVVLAARRPASVRFEALSPSRDFLALLASDGARFVSFQRGEDACYEGPACPLNVGRLLPLRLPGESVVSLLLGEAPVIAHEEAELEFDTETGRYVVTLHAPARAERERIAFDAQDLAARDVRVWRRGELLFRLSFDELRRFGDARLPTRIHFQMPENGVDLSLDYRDVELAPEGLDDELFHAPCPAGTERWWLSCDGTPPRRLDGDAAAPKVRQDGPRPVN